MLGAEVDTSSGYPPPQRGEPPDHRLPAAHPPGRPGQLGPFRATASYLLKPVPSGTRLANNVELEAISALPQPIGPLAVPRVKAGVPRNLGTLKELLESTRPATQVSP